MVVALNMFSNYRKRERGQGLGLWVSDRAFAQGPGFNTQHDKKKILLRLSGSKFLSLSNKRKMNFYIQVVGSVTEYCLKIAKLINCDLRN